ncbi:hypothetical protein JW935_05740 [candidate division KSB1 bacterium]|nr:hypothetical protein [candidate division KSB1 bacterium]
MAWERILLLFLHCGKTDNITDIQGAQSWKKFADLGQSELVKNIYFISQKTGFLIGSHDTHFRTDDDGKTWKPLNINTGLSLYTTIFSIGRVVVIKKLPRQS